MNEKQPVEPPVEPTATYIPDLPNCVELERGKLIQEGDIVRYHIYGQNEDWKVISVNNRFVLGSNEGTVEHMMFPRVFGRGFAPYNKKYKGWSINPSLFSVLRPVKEGEGNG